MVSTVNKIIIESILKRELKFDDFNFEPSTWHDAFIVELLKWFDKKIKIAYKKYEHMPDWFDESKIFYEQNVRFLYYFVVYMNIQDSNQLSNIFNYLFTDENSIDKHHNPHISSEFLIELYNFVINNIPNLKKDYRDREYIDVLIDKLNNVNMHNKLNCIEVRNKLKNKIIYIIDNFDDIDSNYYKSEDEEIILKFLKDFSKDISIKLK